MTFCVPLDWNFALCQEKGSCYGGIFGDRVFQLQFPWLDAGCEKASHGSLWKMSDSQFINARKLQVLLQHPSAGKALSF